MVLFYKITTIFMLIVLSLYTFTGCNETNMFLGNDTEEEAELVTLTELSIPIEKVRTLNPVISKDEDAYYLNKLIYEGLFELDHTLTPEEVLAASYEYGAEGDSLTISLRKDVLWQDGEVFTAEDVKFSIDAYLSVLNKAGTIYDSNISIIKSAKVIDEYTILIMFHDKNNVAVENLTFPVIPKHKFGKAADVQKITDAFIPMGTGPYRLDSIEPGRQLILTGNPSYRGQIPENKLIFKIMPGSEEAINLFEIHEINMSFLKEMDRNTLLNYKDVNVVSFPSNEVEVLGYNFKHGALQDRRVRQAIAYAIDNETIIETCYFNSGMINDSVYYPNYLGVENDKGIYEYDLEKARTLMKESGYQGLSLSLLFNGDNQARNLTAQMIKTDLNKIGISVSLIPLNWEDYNEALTANEYDLYIGGFQIKDTYDIRPLLHTEYNNLIGYSNLRLDILLDRMQTAISTDEKKKVFVEVQELLKTEIPYYCLLYKTYGIAVPSGFNGMDVPYFYDIYDGSENWSFTYEIR